MDEFYGGMEGGGTKFVCAISDGTFRLLDKIQFPTTMPDETLGHAITFFKKYTLKAIGLSVFGPVDINGSSRKFGYITTTPKRGWSGIDIILPFKQEFNVPISFTLDVNAAVLGEYALSPVNTRLKNLVYITVGTGIGAGIISNGTLLSGLSHPEVGHMRIPHDKHLDPFPGICPYHGDCLEGLASGPAIHSRWNALPSELPSDHPAWDLESDYLASALINIILTLSPQRIILGGGVMNQEKLFPLIRKKIKLLLNKYLLFPEIVKKMNEYITNPGLGANSGVLGALVMAKQLLIKNE